MDSAAEDDIKAVVMRTDGRAEFHTHRPTQEDARVIVAGYVDVLASDHFELVFNEEGSLIPLKKSTWTPLLVEMRLWPYNTPILGNVIVQADEESGVLPQALLSEIKRRASTVDTITCRLSRLLISQS